MGSSRRKRQKRELQTLVEAKRRRDMQEAPCQICGRTPLAEVRFLFEGEDPCPGCQTLIEQHGDPSRVYAIKDVVPVDPDAPEDDDDEKGIA